MSKNFEFPQELMLGAVKGDYSFENGISVNGNDYAVMIDKSNNLMVIKNKALQSKTAKKIASSMIKEAQISQEQINGELAKLSAYKQVLIGKNQENGREF